MAGHLHREPAQGGARSLAKEQIDRSMKPNTLTAHRSDARPNRVLVALAAAWMILSLNVGGAVTADDGNAQGGSPTSITGTISQP